MATVALCANSVPGCDGSHTAVGTQPFGLLVHGYGDSSSYMFPGGTGVAK